MAIRHHRDAGRQDTSGPGHPQPPHPAGRLPARVARIVLAATAVGLLTGFFGVGGGFLVAPALVLALTFDMPTAVGTSLLVIAVNSATALASRIGTPVHLDWPVLATFTTTAVAGGLLGGPIVSRVRPETADRRVHPPARRHRRLHRRPQPAPPALNRRTPNTTPAAEPARTPWPGHAA